MKKASDLIALEQLARRIADAAPRKRGTYVFAASIPWDLILELRALLKGIDEGTDR